MAQGIGGAVGCDGGDPRLKVMGGHPAQDRVDEAGRARSGDLPGQVHRRGDGRVRADPGREQLVRAQAEHVAHGRVDLVEPAGAAGGDHGVVRGLPAQRPVAELGRQRGVAPGQPAFPQQRR